MNIRILFPAALSLVFCSTVFSADVRARLLGKDGSDKDVLIIEYKKNTVIHHSSAKDLNKENTSVSSLDGIYFYEPTIYTSAMNLYKERKFQEAKKMFAKCAADLKSVETAKGNHATLAGFYKLECSRRMLNLKALGEEQSKFREGPLDNELHKSQLELNVLWEAARLKDWDRLNDIAGEWAGKEISNSQLAQVMYCQALALEQQGLEDPDKKKEAIAKYNKVMVIDHTLSIELVISSAEKLLNIYFKDPEVQIAMQLWGTKNQNENSKGYERLVSANALVTTYQLASFEKVKPLTADHKEFLKFKPEDSKEEAKPAKK